MVLEEPLLRSSVDIYPSCSQCMSAIFGIVNKTYWLTEQMAGMHCLEDYDMNGQKLALSLSAGICLPAFSLAKISTCQD